VTQPALLLVLGSILAGVGGEFFVRALQWVHRKACATPAVRPSRR
jgi:hypothetical protein